MPTKWISSETIMAGPKKPLSLEDVCNTMLAGAQEHLATEGGINLGSQEDVINLCSAAIVSGLPELEKFMRADAKTDLEKFRWAVTDILVRDYGERVKTAQRKMPAADAAHWRKAFAAACNEALENGHSPAPKSLNEVVQSLLQDERKARKKFGLTSIPRGVQ